MRNFFFLLGYEVMCWYLIVGSGCFYGLICVFFCLYWLVDGYCLCGVGRVGRNWLVYCFGFCIFLIYLVEELVFFLLDLG